MMACLILMSSVGINIYTHACASKDISEISLFQITKCAEKKVVESCCSSRNRSGAACKAPSLTQKEVNTHKDNTCCDYRSKYLSSENPIISSSIIEFFSLDSFPIVLVFVKNLCKTNTLSSLENQWTDSTNKIPFPSAKGIRISIQQFLI